MRVSFDIQEDDIGYTVEPVGDLKLDPALILAGYLKFVLKRHYSEPQEAIDYIADTFEDNSVGRVIN